MSFLKKSLPGAHVRHSKNTENCACQTLPPPTEVCIIMAQHMGAPCEPKVAKGDAVKVGTLIGDTDAFLSVPIHASVSGTVSDIVDFTTSGGAKTKAVVIQSDGLMEADEAIAPPVIENHQDFVKAIRASGLVGLGGAGFPTHIKLNPKNLAEIDTLVVNGAECEPYITSDYRTMLDRADDVLAGIRAIQKHLGISSVKIAIESNKPQAIEHLKKCCAQESGIEVVALPPVYPKGAEKVTIFESTGRVVPEGKLPSDSGVIVNNITTVAFIGEYLRTGMPLVSKCLTVDGDAVAEPKNVLVPIGTRFADVIAFCGGYKAQPGKLLMGGPMMGIAVPSDSYPVLKNNNALLAFDKAQTEQLPEQACIRCGRCAHACPYKLMPRQIEMAYDSADVHRLNKLKVMLCMECGCCSYVCPAKRDLTFTNKLAKQLVRESANKVG